MVSRTQKGCYISAPFGFDLSLFRSLLEARGISSIDQSLLSSTESWDKSIVNFISRSDFFCGVIPDDVDVNAVFFELGIACAKNKPIILFLGKKVFLPSLYKKFTSMHLDLDDESAITLFLDSFLAYGDRAPQKKEISKKLEKSPNLSWFDSERNNITSNNADYFESSIEKLFKESNYLIQSNQYLENKPVDFAIWLDQLGEYFNNPILVETKYGNLNKQLVEKTEDRLRNLIEKTGGDIGLFIYNDKNNKENFSGVSNKWPLIFKFSLGELVKLLRNGELEAKIIEIRNQIAHGRL